MRFGRIDVTEAQMTVITVMMLTVALGPSFWDIEVGLVLSVGLEPAAQPQRSYIIRKICFEDGQGDFFSL